MFFARLAVAALTFGSFAQVFSAPIVVDDHPASLSAVHNHIQNFPRDGPLNFLDAVSKVDRAVQEANDVIDTPNVDANKVSGALLKVDGALAGVVAVLGAPGSDVASIRQDVDGVKELTTEAVAVTVNTVQTKVGELVVKVTSLKTINLAASTVKSIEGRIIQIYAGLITTIPELVPLVGGVLATILTFLTTGLQNMGITVEA